MDDNGSFRAKLGARLVFWTTIALSVLAAIIMIGAAIAQHEGEKDSVLRTAQLLLSTLLPLFGTWVGTVLAFYYTKENFEAASKNTLDLVRLTQQRLSSTPVTEKMMLRANIVAEIIPSGKGLSDLTISAIDMRFRQLGANGKPISRLLILDGTDIFLAVLHRSVYAEMLASTLRDSSPIDPAQATISSLIKKQYPAYPGDTYETFIRRTTAFVAQDKTLSDAKTAMEQLPDCQDVIVTRSGTANERIIGWVSNVDISRASQAS
jgi:hypothetical protein